MSVGGRYPPRRLPLPVPPRSGGLRSAGLGELSPVVGSESEPSVGFIGKSGSDSPKAPTKLAPSTFAPVKSAVLKLTPARFAALTPFPPEDYLFSGRLKSDRKYFSSGEN